jgi:hypothetical protein
MSTSLSFKTARLLKYQGAGAVVVAKIRRQVAAVATGVRVA